jgi:hypothetical protein
VCRGGRAGAVARKKNATSRRAETLPEQQQDQIGQGKTPQTQMTLPISKTMFNAHAPTIQADHLGGGRNPLVAAFELHPLGQEAGDSGEMETSIAEADAQGEPEEGAGQAGEVLSDGTTKLREVGLDQSSGGEGETLIHLYK